MRSEKEIKERISYYKQCILKDVTTGLISVEALKNYRTAIEVLEDVLQGDDKDA
jgi:hypothetical protein